jgi:hypothetical protein
MDTDEEAEASELGDGIGGGVVHQTYCLVFRLWQEGG